MFHKDQLVVGQFHIPIAISGSGSSTLICVNGMQQTMAIWGSLVRRMAPTDYRTVLFDFPHQGRASALEDRHSLSLHEQMEVLSAVVLKVSPTTPVALIGGSWGALVAAAYAATHPQRVSRLVVGGFQTTPNVKLREVARRGRALVEEGRGAELADLFLEEFGSGIETGRRSAIEAQFRSLRAEQFRQMYDSARLLVDGADFESMYDLGRVAAHTLIVNGDADPLIDSADTVRTAMRFPAATWHIAHGVGHFLHLERPSLLDVYRRFLTEDRPATPFELRVPQPTECSDPPY